MNYWLMKTEPNTFSWDDLVNKGKDIWDGVRNYAARKHMMEMKMDDLVLFYHSVNEKSVVGIAKIVKEFYPDPTTEDDRWVVVEVAPERKLENPVTLDVIKADTRLTKMVLVNNSRLSVQPVTQQEYKMILELSAQ